MTRLSNAQADEAARLPSHRPVTNAVNALIRSLGDLDQAGQARAAICRALSQKLDQIGESKTGASVLAASRASRDLALLLEGLVNPGSQAAAAALLRDIFRDD